MRPTSSASRNRPFMIRVFCILFALVQLDHAFAKEPKEPESLDDLYKQWEKSYFDRFFPIGGELYQLEEARKLPAYQKFTTNRDHSADEITSFLVERIRKRKGHGDHFLPFMVCELQGWNSRNLLEVYGEDPAQTYSLLEILPVHWEAVKKVRRKLARPEEREEKQDSKREKQEKRSS